MGKSTVKKRGYSNYYSVQLARYQNERTQDPSFKLRLHIGVSASYENEKNVNIVVFCVFYFNVTTNTNTPGFSDAGLALLLATIQCNAEAKVKARTHQCPHPPNTHWRKCGSAECGWIVDVEHTKHETRNTETPSSHIAHCTLKGCCFGFIIIVMHLDSNWDWRRCYVRAYVPINWGCDFC